MNHNREGGGYSLVSLGELMARPNAPVVYLLEGILVAGTVSAVVAKPKVGKSTFARNVAISVSTGRPFLGRATVQGEVLYLALEEREEEIKADFLAMGAVGDEPIHIHAANAPQEAMAELVELVRNRKPRLIIIDPLFRLARIRDEKAYAETYQALGPLIDIARETGSHILLTHHAGKSVKTDAIDAPLGSTALGGLVSTLVYLKRSERYRTIETVQRIGKELEETLLGFDADTRTLSLGTRKAENEHADAEKRILERLEDALEPLTQEQIRDKVEGQTKTIRAALTSLTQSGRINQTGEGRRGKPYLYERWFSGSQHISGTREPQIPDEPQTRIAGDENLVPRNGGRPMPNQGLIENSGAN
jgi:RecA-family ATPase